MAIVYAVANAKGGVGKTTTAINLGAALAAAGKHVLLIDNDPQKANLTLAMNQANELRYTLSNLIFAALDCPEDLPDYIDWAILHVNEMDLIPANKRLSGVATRLAIEGSAAPADGAGAPERALRAITDALSARYDFIIIDCGPKLDTLMTAALTAADHVIIPVQAHYLAEEGISDIMETVRFVQGRYNPALKVSGILLTMYQAQTNLCRSVQELVKEQYGETCRIFKQPIALSVKVAEHPAYGESLIHLDPKHPAALAYTAMAAEVLASA